MGTTPEQPIKLAPSGMAFGNNYSEDQTCRIRVVNESDKLMAFRIRCTFPDYYRMPTPEGYLDPKGGVDLEIIVKKGFPWVRDQIVKHKFEALSLDVAEEERKSKTINQIFSDGMEPLKTEIPVVLQPPAGQTK